MNSSQLRAVVVEFHEPSAGQSCAVNAAKGSRYTDCKIDFPGESGQDQGLKAEQAVINWVNEHT
jgi:hypothetical protein